MNPAASTAFPGFPARIESPSGLRLEINANGSLRRIDHGDIMINLFPGNEVEGGLANVFLRILGEEQVLVPLLGPESPAGCRFDDLGLFSSGRVGDVLFRLRLVLSGSATVWFWHVEVENIGNKSINCDLLFTQDTGLAHYGAIRLNEYYVSQYVDHSPLDHPERGCMVASRQNQSMGGRFPWMLSGSLGRAVSFATDALQFHGLAARGGGRLPVAAGGLPGRRLQHEHSMVCLQDETITLEPGAMARRGFFALFVPDKPNATEPEDAALADAVLALPEAAPPDWPSEPVGVRPAASLFTTAPRLHSLPLDESARVRWFGAEMLHEEREDGRLLSFFTPSGSHVVLGEKERMVLRPHGHLLRSGGAMVPDEAALTSTVWINGVFHSMVTQGHVSINRLLSTCHTYLGLFRSHGQRIFMENGGQWYLLDLPSAFEMSLDRCRWLYRHAGGLVEVISTAPENAHRLEVSVTVLEGPPARFLFSHHVALNGDDGSGNFPVQWESRDGAIFLKAMADSDVGRRFPEGGFLIRPADDAKPEFIGGDELLFADGQSRQQPFLCIVTEASHRAGLSIEGRLIETTVPMEEKFWETVGAGLSVEVPPANSLAEAGVRAATMFPWFAHNALVHYLSPRGLEQYSGGGWGTRDVCQGPVELLQALGRFEPIRDLLCRVFRQQNPDGDWPQWFMFFDRERNIRPGDSHGDIVYWPVLALAQYLEATGDATLLEVELPFFHGEGDAAAESGTIRQHVERALDLMQRRVIPGTLLAAYGHGDWNDSLQPAKPEMREMLCSSWTVTLGYQTFVTLANAFEKIGETERAAAMQAVAAEILEQFQRVLVVDGVIAGLAYFHPDGKTEHLLHPRDQTTGLSYSLLPMIHAIINGMLTPAQATEHLAIIRGHLSGPDGARLFDRPMPYHGGPQRYFQRAESASFFGREIGIMYTHAHLRYCEALARFGDAPAFFHALCQAIPIGIREIVSSATLRQANCYFSSSDAAFADRYDAFENYDKVNRGEVPLEGGWRVYSSGAGIASRLIVQCFLGLRVEADSLVIDPVIPPALDGMVAAIELAGGAFKLCYRVAERGCGPMRIQLDGEEIPFTRETNPYRTGAARIPMSSLTGGKSGAALEMVVWLE